MQIDIAELLIVSWLRHERKCQLVQTNWKIPSWGWIEDNKLEERLKNAEKFLSEVKRRFPEDDQKLFGIQKINQLIKQVEIDVLGAAWDNEGKFEKIIAGDVAYHSKGLNYYRGNSEIKVVSKILRTLLSIYVYWGDVSVEVFFAAPRVNPTPQKKIQKRVEELISILKASKLGKMDIDIALYLQESFREEIRNRVHAIISDKDYTNAAELYMRAYQLSVNGQDSLGNKNKGDTIEKDEAIGKFVRTELVKFLTDSNVELLDKMCDIEGTREAKLGLPFSMLMREKEYNDYPELRNRYYRTFTIDKNGSLYRLCNHWYPKNENPLKKWMKRNGWEEKSPKEEKL